MNQTATLKTKTCSSSQGGSMSNSAPKLLTQRSQVTQDLPCHPQPVGERIRFQTSEIGRSVNRVSKHGGRVCVCVSQFRGGVQNNVHNVLTSIKGVLLRLPTDTKTTCVHAQCVAKVLNGPDLFVCFTLSVC